MKRQDAAPGDRVREESGFDSRHPAIG